MLAQVLHDRTRYEDAHREVSGEAKRYKVHVHSAPRQVLDCNEEEEEHETRDDLKAELGGDVLPLRDRTLVVRDAHGTASPAAYKRLAAIVS